MTAGRSGHTATLLHNGKALVAGGVGPGGAATSPLATAELYNPATRTWTNTGPMNAGRLNHIAVLLPDGKVLVAGGGYQANGLSFGSAELYDPVSGTWTNTVPMIKPRANFTATALPNGKVLVAGGWLAIGGAALSTAELYDPTNATWTLVTNNMTDERSFHTCTLLPDGKLYVAGGFGSPLSSARIKSSADLYDPVLEKWTSTTSLNLARYSHTATSLANGLVLLAGGSGTNSSPALASAEMYNPSAATCVSTNAMAVRRGSHTATLLPDGTVLVTCGKTETNVLASAELFNPPTGTWTLTPNEPIAARYAHTATLLLDGTVLVAGGFDDLRGTNALSNTELYNSGYRPAAVPFSVTSATISSSGAFLLGFTNIPGTAFDVLATTNLFLPIAAWTRMGSALEDTPGCFKFTDSQAGNTPRRFYTVQAR